MKRSIMALALSLSATVGLAATRYEQSSAAPEDPRFAFLKTLAGTWDATSDNAEVTASTFEYRVSAGGTVLMEYLMKDTPMEMVTLYHMDGDDLVGTHYCMVGNQPRLLSSDEVVDQTLTFTCDGKVSNAASHDDPHIHGWTLELDAEGKLVYEAEMVAAGEVMEKPSFTLTRRQ